MSATDRRAEIMRILNGRRHETMRRLADELSVSDRTIRSDISNLTADYPLQTVRGHSGCVSLSDWYRPHRNILSREQQEVLEQMTELADPEQAKVLREVLDAYGSTKRKESSK